MAEAPERGVRWGPDGLVPVVTVDSATGRVLMLAYADRRALEATLATGDATYFSRSRGELWTKGQTSGSTQRVRAVRIDCDGDALLYEVQQHGTGACHTGRWSCFHRTLFEAEQARPGPAAVPDARILDALSAVIRERRLEPRPGSYTSALLQRGVDGALKKVAEECGEVILAGKAVADLKSAGAPGASLGPAYDALAWEAADLLYHLLVALEAAGLPVEAVWRELARRRGPQPTEG